MFDVYRKDNGRRVTVFAVHTAGTSMYDGITFFLTWNEDVKMWQWIPADEYQPVFKKEVK